MAAEETVHYFKANIPNSFSVRMYKGDHDGIVLGQYNQIVEVKDSQLKVFKSINRYALNNGYLKELEEEPEDVINPDNVLDLEDIQELLAAPTKLKAKLPNITSVPILYQILQAAQEKGSAKSTLKLIEAQIAEVEPDAPSMDAFERLEMGGSYDVQ